MAQPTSDEAPLIPAVRDGNHDRVRELLADGADPNAVSAEGKTALERIARDRTGFTRNPRARRALQSMRRATIARTSARQWRTVNQG